MNSQIAKPTINPLAPTVFAILDSRIQFLEYQVKNQFASQKQPSNYCVTAYEQLMDFYGKTCKSLKLLQILKEWVSENNAAIILNLLQDDAYLAYSENQIEEMIQFKDFHFAV